MNIKPILLVAALALPGSLAVSSTGQAVNPTDKVPEIVCDSYEVPVGATLHCTVSNTDGLTPGVKITWTNPRTRQTLNVWNGEHQSFDVTYTPNPGEAGRVERLSATINYPATGHLVRPSVGSVSFTVLAA